MKRLVDLTVEDLRQSPAWRYEGGDGSEALVEPAARETLSQDDDEIFLASTEFELADRSRHFGFCFPADDSGLDYLQPVILTDAGPVSFWFDRPPSPETIARQWSALGRQPTQIFPAVFRCLVPVDGRTVRGRIEQIATPEDEEAAAAEEAPRPAADPPPLTARPVAARRRGARKVEKRTSLRRAAEIAVEFAQGPLQATGITGDVSRRGMFVRSPQLPGTGPLLRLTVKLPGGRKLELKGRVVRHGPASSHSSAPRANGFGLRLAEEWPEYENLFPPRRDKPEEPPSTFREERRRK